MKITKYNHACLLLEKDSQKLILDPGAFTTLPSDVSGIKFIVISEEHFDHFNLDNVQAILQASPDAKIYTTQAVVDALQADGISAQAVSGTQTIELGVFSVSFYEHDHAVVYKKSPCKSLAIKIDEALYYPSDTYQAIDEKVTVLAIPTSGPWYKVSESIELMNAMQSDIVMPTHNALNSEIGNKVTHSYLQNNLDDTRDFRLLSVDESIDV